MSRKLLICLLFLSACNTAPLGFAGVEATRVVVGQSTFDVRVKGTRAHALRVNMEFAPNLAAVAPRAREAIEQASGCRMVPGTLTGDQASMTAELDC